MNAMVVTQPVPEIILIDKPKGITSFGVIRELRKKYGIKKMGHSGTLDPLATGLLVIGVGRGTKKLKEYIKLPKVYETHILLGKRTSTGDMEGEVVEEKVVTDVSLEKLQEVVSGLVGPITLPVPFYSAIKLLGVPLYLMARRGKDMPALPLKEMEIYWIKLLDHEREGDTYVIHLEMYVKSGTYVRSIAEEIGRRLGVPATVKDLRRISIGDFNVKDSDKL